MTAGLGALAPVVARKHVEAAALRCGAAALWATAEAAPAARGFIEALRAAPGAIVAEMKRRSPSGGELRDRLDPAALAAAYQRAGAAALSVLTDGPGFGGSLADLGGARGACALPVLRKDFTVDPVQVAEARAGSADCVLLIVAVLGPDGLADCLAAAERAGLDALVEVHDAAEARIAVAAGAGCVGVNNRDLRSLRTDLGTFARIRAALPGEVLCVAESGVRGPADVRRLVAEGADAVLVGEALMRSADAGAACAELAAAGGEVAGARSR